jgi:TPR repeat protein
MYRDGVGTDRDPEEAAEWFELAAEQGHGHAAMVLGELLLRGEGVDRDYVEAFVWSSIAADRLSGEDEQQATAIRQAAKDQLSAAEHDEARRRIADLAQ